MNWAVLGKRFQVLPWSVDFQIPAPFTASAFAVGSPVVKYISSGFAGFWHMDEMARLSKKSFMGSQFGMEERKLVVFHKPPATPPVKTVLPVGSVSVSTRKVMIRPDV